MQPYVCDYLNGAPSFLLTSPVSHLLNPADFTPARCSCSRHNFRFLRVLPPGLWSTCLLQAADHGRETLHLLRVLPPGLWSTGLSRAADQGPKTRDTTLAASLAARPVEHRPVTGSGPGAKDQRHYTCCQSCRPACGAPACHGQRTRGQRPETLHLLPVLPPGLWSTGLSRAADQGPKTRDTTLAASLAARPVEHRPVTGSGPGAKDQRHYTCCQSCCPACGAPACYRQQTTDLSHYTCCSISQGTKQ